MVHGTVASASTENAKMQIVDVHPYPLIQKLGGGAQQSMF